MFSRRQALGFGLFILTASWPSAGLPQGQNHLLASDAHAGDLKVVISGVRSAKGAVIVWLWTGPDGFAQDNDKAFKVMTLDASAAVDGKVTAEWSLPPGVYAVTTLHDENNNGKLDMNFLGIPTEGFGVSNNVMAMGPPAFKDAQFTVERSALSISIKLRYF